MVDPQTLSADWAKLRHLGESLYDKKMFFNKKWCAYPKKDFNELFKNIAKGLDVRLNTTVKGVDLKTGKITLDSQTEKADLIVSSLSLDKLFNYQFGKLGYRGYTIEPKIIHKDSYHPQNPETGNHYSMVYYPEDDVTHNRTTEYKWFNHKAKLPEYQGKTIITVETPNDRARFYPFMNPENEKRFTKYLKKASTFPKLLTIGRMGLYKYTTLDTTTAQAYRFITRANNWLDFSPAQRYTAYQAIRGNWKN